MTEIFQQSSCGKQLKCLVCCCWLPSSAEKFIESHLNGRKHKQQVDKKEEKERILKCSIYVKGFDTHLDNLEDDLKSYFESYNIKVKDLYVDKNKASYAIVEFDKIEDVDKVINADRSKFHNQPLICKRREESKRKLIHTETSTSKTSNLGNDTCLLPKELQKHISSISEISLQMEALQKYMELNEADLDLRKLICDLLKNVLEEVYPGCKIKSFGSSANGLGVKNCDLDITLITTEDISNEIEVVNDIREIVQRFAPGCKNVSVVESSKNCSIVKFYHTESKLNVDLSVNNKLALLNTQLLKEYCCKDDRVLPLLHTIRMWASCNKKTGRQTTQLTNYALTLMVIWYLQRITPPVLPCLQGGVELLEQVVVGPWNCTFNQHETFCSLNKLVTGELLHGFFDYFVSFSYNAHAITIHSPTLQTRTDCKSKANQVDSRTSLNIETAIVIQDPFKLSHNVAHNLSKEGLNLLIEEFQQAKNLLTPSISIKQSLMTLFAKQNDTNTRTKQKQKRNRSNVYQISLPNCNHVNKNGKVCCTDFVKRFLLITMKMTIISERNNMITERVPTEPIRIITKEKVSSSIQDILSGGENVVVADRKRKLVETKDDETLKLKKQKLDEILDNVVYLVSVKSDTWTKRRKQRRHEERETTIGNIIDTKVQMFSDQSPDRNISNGSIDTDKITDCIATDAPITEDNIVPSTSPENITAIKNPSNSELFRFNVKIQIAETSTGVCKVTLEPTDVTMNLLKFQTFYAFLKKEIIQVFK